MFMWEEYNPNPLKIRVGDCSVRAISKALNTDWETAFILLAINAFIMGNVISADSVWGSVLRQHGFYRDIIPNSCPDCYTAKDFMRDHPDGVYVLGFGGHVATVKDGKIYDAWDSTNEIPQFYYYKKEEK